MTNEEKQLLLKDLCARIPNHVKVELHGEICTCLGYFDDFVMLTSNTPLGQQTNIANIKPYLRPMSSMTDEEREEWADLFNLELDKLNEIDDEDKAEELAPYYFGKSHQVSIDWLNKKGFDYRGLIPMGLALEAPEGIYKTE